MKIKDVETLTGLTAKSIRLYESRGLLTVDRNRDNEYREFTEEHVNQLRIIRLLRCLDFSISDISDLLKREDAEVTAILQSKLEEYEQHQEELGEKAKLCRALRKNYSRAHAQEVAEEYLDSLIKLEDPDLQELTEDLKNAAQPSLGSVLMTTLLTLLMVGMTPVLSRSGMADFLVLGFYAFALGDTIFCTLLWRRYLSNRRRMPNRQKTRDRGSWFFFVILFITIVVAIAAAYAMTKLQIALLAPGGWLFFELHRWNESMIFLLIEVPCITILGALGYAKTKNYDFKGDFQFLLLAKKVWPVLLAMWCLLFYCVFTSVQVVTGDALIRHSPLHPAGVSHTYEEVTAVECGYRRNGDFYYKVTAGGDTFTFSSPMDNGAKDSYRSLEELDSALMAHHPAKTVNTAYEDRNDFEAVYQQRFTRILANQ